MTTHARAADGQFVGVVQTGARAGALAVFLQKAGIETEGPRPQAPLMSALQGDLADSIIALYHGLGGRASEPSLRPGARDLVVDGSLLVEVDEELHFNRYRLATLQPAWTHALPWRDDYLNFCERMESLCLTGLPQLVGRFGLDPERLRRSQACRVV